MSTIFHQVIIDSDVKTVYDALTTQEGLAGWWTPEVTAKPELYFINQFKFGDLIHNEMEIIDLKPDQRVEWVCVKSVEEWQGTLIVFDLEARKDCTVLNFKHTGYPEENAFFANCNFNWARFLISLRDLCETGKGSPFSGEKDLKEIKTVRHL